MLLDSKSESSKPEDRKKNIENMVKQMMAVAELVVTDIQKTAEEKAKALPIVNDEIMAIVRELPVRFDEKDVQQMLFKIKEVHMKLKKLSMGEQK